MTATEHSYERHCIFCGHAFLSPDPRAIFCSPSCQRRELDAIVTLERTPPGEGFPT